MERIVINKIGPIKYCDLQINDIMVFTGPQAAGKSTIAKSIFFFKNIKKLKNNWGLTPGRKNKSLMKIL